MQSKVLFHKDDHQWVVIGRDPEKDDHVIDTNEYVIIHRGHAMLLDPGGIQIFPRCWLNWRNMSACRILR